MGTDATELAARRLRLRQAEGRPVAWWGVILLSITESMLFGLLLFSYFYLWAVNDVWPPEGVADPELVRSGIRSLLLFASSATIWYGERAVRAGDRGRAWLGFASTFVIAVVFLAGHVRETLHLLSEHAPGDHAYHSIVYTLTNFHAAHLTAGVLMIGYLMVRLGRGAYGPDDDTHVGVVSIYWHFVDGVWALVYSSLYLAPNLL